MPASARASQGSTHPAHSFSKFLTGGTRAAGQSLPELGDGMKQFSQRVAANASRVIFPVTNLSISDGLVG